jgi:hypothetical protein
MNVGRPRGDPMRDKTIPSDFRVDVGRADRGRTFVRVIHIATGKDRIIVGIGKSKVTDLAFELFSELSKEIEARTSFRGAKSDA